MSAGWEVVIGLECHAQLACVTKMFCACRVASDGPPNHDVCPIYLGHPGTLPSLNGQAVALGVRAALALACTLHPVSRFARKHYFYPDLPKGYQITQDDRPLATQGTLHLGDRAFRIARMHLEEDSGKMGHGPDGTLVDWNRAGVPLLEIVGAPDLNSPEDAEEWLRTLHRVLGVAGVCTGDLEKAHFRCDANVSVHRPGTGLGTRVEVKNLNSFRFVARALRFEYQRQVAQLESGGAVAPETRGWDGHRTVSLRRKEGPADYRYIPEPDLPALRIDATEIRAATDALPGVPLDLHLAALDQARTADWQARYGLDAADVVILSRTPDAARLYADAVAAGGTPREMANLVKGDVLRRVNEGGLGLLTGAHLAGVEGLVSEGAINRESARKVLDVLAREGGSPGIVAGALGLRQVGDRHALEAVVAAVVQDHPEELARYRAGNRGLQGFFIGQVMTATGRQADPKLAARLVREALEGV